MNLLKKFFCRAYQTAFHLALPLLPYREPTVLNELREIITVLQASHLTSVLLVTDPGLRRLGLTVPLEEALQRSGIHCAVYSETCANPTLDNVEDARQLYVKEHCEALIAFGGGSPMDCAKATGARIAYPKKTLYQLRGTLRVFRKIPPLFAIPTTAGTGSEVTLTAVITDKKSKHKYTMNDFPLIPSYAVLDASLTYSLPPHLTATTGMDALTHAVEAYIGRSTSKETREKALTATKLIFENLETAYEFGTDFQARSNMLRAAYLAGIAFSKSYVGYVHAVAHSLGGQYNIPHGLANSVLLPVVLEAYESSVYKKLHALGMAAGVVRPEDSYEEGAKKFISAIRKMNMRMNIPTKFNEIKQEDIPVMAKHADKEANPLYPVPKLMNAKELERFYHQIANWS